ncbi:MAG: hypothetical protein GF388_10560, partial [Candidatus Aegiribacteria sp.]|nr:hypothetical protein [Candidatus Aegiribacteria sp.]MBD3295463.1 hypothetical protein [Candidatus Fermentibacteria bacterium]
MMVSLLMIHFICPITFRRYMSMKLTILSTLLSAAVLFAAGMGSVSSWQSFGGFEGEAPEITLLESDHMHMVLEIDMPGFWLFERPENNAVWNAVAVPGCYSQGRVGLPDLPSITELFALPFGTEAVVSVENITTATYENTEIMPRQIPEVDMDHAPYPFAISEDFYSGSNAYPVKTATVDNQGTWSGLNVARLVVNPFSYNPDTGSLQVISSMTVRVDFEGGASAIAEPVNPSMVSAMETSVLNWSSFAQSATSLGSRGDAVEYVFICTDETEAWVSELFTFHNTLGLHTRVETLTAPATTDDIKTAITDNYETGVTRFACIVGTNDDLPSYVWDGKTGDYWYGCLTGGDYFAEVAIGRLTGNQTQIEHQVDKIIDGYANFNFDDKNTTGIIPSLSVLAAHGENYPGKYTQCCNEIAAYDYSLMDFTFTKVYPPEGGTAADVSNAINNGNGIVTYRGHGMDTYWTWAPNWDASNINALTNTFMPPVFNIACYNGNYTGGGTCLSEAWQWADNGSSGNIGATDPSYTEANHTYIKEIYKEIYDNGVYRVMEAVNAATVTTINDHGTYGEANAKMYVWFGDPAMNLWTFDEAGYPEPLLIDPPDEILPGNQDVTVSVTANGSPVEGALVTLTDGVDNYT